MNRICTLIAEETARTYAPQEVTPDDTFRDLSFDGIDRAAIAVAIEDEYGITLRDPVVDGWSSVADVIATVAAMRGVEA